VGQDECWSPSVISAPSVGDLESTLFHKTFFSELETLRGDTGAKSIVRQYRSCCSTIPFAEGAIDLDTPQDLDIIIDDASASGMEPRDERE
jgi:CTP:molybdopterin cytidylyltransferase MocA